MNSDVLLSETVAEAYHREFSWKSFDNARDLVDDIELYMAARGLAKSSISRLDVAEHVLKLRDETGRQVATPEETAFQTWMEQGTTADDAALLYMDELALAGRVRQMDMDAYGAQRQSLGLDKSTAAHLGGWQQ